MPNFEAFLQSIKLSTNSEIGRSEWVTKIVCSGYNLNFAVGLKSFAHMTRWILLPSFWGLKSIAAFVNSDHADSDNFVQYVQRVSLASLDLCKYHYISDRSVFGIVYSELKPGKMQFWEAVCIIQLNYRAIFDAPLQYNTGLTSLGTCIKN